MVFCFLLFTDARMQNDECEDFTWGQKCCWYSSKMNSYFMRDRSDGILLNYVGSCRFFSYIYTLMFEQNS